MPVHALRLFPDRGVAVAVARATAGRARGARPGLAAGLATGPGRGPRGSGAARAPPSGIPGPDLAAVPGGPRRTAPTTIRLIRSSFSVGVV